MAKISRATVESALRDRKLDRTLTTALPSIGRSAEGGPLTSTGRSRSPGSAFQADPSSAGLSRPLGGRDRDDPAELVATDVAALDACLHGGCPRGQVSEIAGPPSSGRTALLLTLVGAATRRGEIAAIVDTFDRLDIASTTGAGIDRTRLLWVRGQAIAGSPPAGVERALDRALKAFTLVLQAGGFGVVALDVADVPVAALTRLPFTTWLRVQRMVEGSDTACVIVAPQPLARSAGGLTLVLSPSTTHTMRWTGSSNRSRLLAGLDVAVRVVSPRRRMDGEVVITASAL